MTISPRIPLWLSVTSLCLALLPAAFGACRKSEPSKADSAGHLLQKARQAMERGDVGSAIQDYRSALHKKPGSADAWNRLGLALEYRYYETGDDAYKDEALSAYRKAVKMDGNCVACLVNEANLLWFTGDRTSAARIYAGVVHMAPDHLDAKAMKSRIRIARLQPSDKSHQKGEQK